MPRARGRAGAQPFRCDCRQPEKRRRLKISTEPRNRLKLLFADDEKSLQEVMRIVQIDPLWIDASVTLSAAMSLKKGQAVQVVFSAPNPQTVDGRVTYVSAVADAGSGTLIARIEVPNKSRRPAGEHVRVVCSSPEEGASAL